MSVVVAAADRRGAIRRSRAEELADGLLSDVLAGVYPPGSALPREADLAESSGLSRLTVREAVKVLQAMGVLRVEQGRGTYVTDTQDWSVLDPRLLLARSARGQDRMLLPLKFIEARRLVEVGVAEIAAGRRTDRHLTELAAALSAMSTTSRAKDAEGFVEADIRFHRIVLEAADNAFIAALFDPLSQILQLTRLQTSAHAPVRTHAITHHRKILVALTSGDAEASRTAMHDHIVQTENDMIKYVQDPAAALDDAAGGSRQGR